MIRKTDVEFLLDDDRLLITRWAVSPKMRGTREEPAFPGDADIVDAFISGETGYINIDIMSVPTMTGKDWPTLEARAIETYEEDRCDDEW